MVLITDDRRKSGGSNAQVHPAKTSEKDCQDEEGDEEDEQDDAEDEEMDEVDFDEVYDTRSVMSDDSFYPPDNVLSDTYCWGNRRRSSVALLPTKPLTFYQACSRNNPLVLRTMIRLGVDQDQVMETDRNERTGLMVACYQGYIDIVMLLAQCPHLDVNWQDREGNTALITAAQAGHGIITNYLLNYFTGLDLEKKNCHGFTALMKAAMQGRVECVRALMTAGGDMNARDHGRKLTAREWAWFTDRYEAAWVMARLVCRPCPRQMSDAFSLEWPQLRSLVDRAQQWQGYCQRAIDQVKSVFSFANVTNPVDHGAIDHLVCATTALRSPFIATACRTVCPETPPCVGVRCYAVPEIVRIQRAKELQALNPQRSNSHQRLFENSRIVSLINNRVSCMDRRTSLPACSSRAPRAPSPPPKPLRSPLEASSEARRTSLMPLHTVRRSSVRPAYTVPKVRVTKAPVPTFEPEKKTRQKSNFKEGGAHLLEIPKLRYKEVKEERKKAEEMERRRLEDMAKRLTKK